MDQIKSSEYDQIRFLDHLIKSSNIPPKIDPMDQMDQVDQIDQMDQMDQIPIELIMIKSLQNHHHISVQKMDQNDSGL